MAFRSGFVNIIGLPNVGKSTLVNQLLGEKLNIVTYKPQTTRHRIMGILEDDEYQMVISDTPGIVSEVSYEMHKKMNQFVSIALEDADILLVVVDVTRPIDWLEDVKPMVTDLSIPVVVAINKIDKVTPEISEHYKENLVEMMSPDHLYMISALQGTHVEELRSTLLSLLPEGEPYFPSGQLSDRNMRFFVSEIIREKIFLQYEKELPYSTEVVVTDYVDEEDICKIRAEIIVERPTQKGIIIGKRGAAIKQIGILARQDIEAFIDKKVYLELFVKVKEKWRNDDRALNQFGYH